MPSSMHIHRYSFNMPAQPFLPLPQTLTPAPPRPAKAALQDAFVGRPISTLRTPAVLIDVSRVRANCIAMLEAAQRWGLDFRAHVKTHKTLEASLIQLWPDPQRPDLKTGRVIVSTLPEAWGLLEVNQASDPDTRNALMSVLVDILYGIPLGINKIEDLYDLRAALRRLSVKGKAAQVRVMIDHISQARALEAFLTVRDSQGAEHADPFSAFIKIDCGYHRAGINEESAQLRELLETIRDDCPHISVYGFYVHAGHSYGSKSANEADSFLTREIDSVNAAAKFAKGVLFAAEGDASIKAHHASRHQFPFVLSVGSTPTAHAARNRAEDPVASEKQRQALAQLEGKLELHAGNYPILDLQQIATRAIPDSDVQGSATESDAQERRKTINDVAISVLSTIIAEYPTRAAEESDVKGKYEWAQDGIARSGDEAMCDAGGLAMSKDTGPLGSFGHVVWPATKIGWQLGRCAQEHGVLTLRSGSKEDWQKEWAYEEPKSRRQIEKEKERLRQEQLPSAEEGEEESEAKDEAPEAEADAEAESEAGPKSAREPEAVPPAAPVKSPQPVRIGDQVRIIPQHACLTAAQYPWYYIVDSTDPQDPEGLIVKDVWCPWKFW